MLEGLPKEIEEYILPPEENCPKCGGSLKVIGKKILRTEVEFIPAKLKVKQIVRQVGTCESCGTKESKNSTPVFKRMLIPDTTRLEPSNVVSVGSTVADTI